MTNEMLAVACSGAAAALDTARRPWIIGVGHLVGVPLDVPELPDASVRSVIDIARSTVEFLSGPVNYIPCGYGIEDNPDYRLLTLRSDAAPHLEMQIGLGIAGFVAVGLTRSDVFDDGTHHPGAVVLADVESVVADTFTMAIGTALELGYTGEITYCVTIVDTRPDGRLQFYAIDDEAGALVAVADGPHTFTPVEATTSYTAETTPRSVHEDIHAIAVDVAAQFGTRPQLVELLPLDHPNYSGDALNANSRR